MRAKHIVVVLAVLAIVGLAVFVLCRANTNLVAIYRVDTASGWPTNFGDARLKGLKLVSPALLADSDFVAFDPTNHTFIITGKAAKRLALAIWGPQGPYARPTGTFELIPFPTPFVLKASGEPIYGGMFYTLVSSASFSGPVILSEEYDINPNVAENATFCFRIELGYPATVPGTADPRGDPRIASAVRKLLASRR